MAIGNKPMQPTHDLSPSDYHNHPAISRSQLKDLQRSPLHYWSRHVDPNRISVQMDTPALRFGTAVHMAALEPDRFGDCYVEGPMVARATKTWKEAQAATPKTLLPVDEMRAIAAICGSIMAHPAACRAIYDAPGHNEATFIATDKATKLDLKCRADRITDSGYIIDLKTTADASASSFAKSVANFGYHTQAAFYMRVVEQATGTRPKGFIFVAVEKEPPFAVQVFTSSEQLIAAGDRQVDALLPQLAGLLESYPADKPWPSYSQQSVILDLPAWADR